MNLDIMNHRKLMMQALMGNHTIKIPHSKEIFQHKVDKDKVFREYVLKLYECKHTENIVNVFDDHQISAIIFVFDQEQQYFFVKNIRLKKFIPSVSEDTKCKSSKNKSRHDIATDPELIDISGILEQFILEAQKSKFQYDVMVANCRKNSQEFLEVLKKHSLHHNACLRMVTSQHFVSSPNPIDPNWQDIIVVDKQFKTIRGLSSFYIHTAVACKNFIFDPSTGYAGPEESWLVQAQIAGWIMVKYNDGSKQLKKLNVWLFNNLEKLRTKNIFAQAEYFIEYQRSDKKYLIQYDVMDNAFNGFEDTYGLILQKKQIFCKGIVSR